MMVFFGLANAGIQVCGILKLQSYYRQFGYERISKNIVTGLGDAGHQGIDGVYYNPNGNPPYIIAEAKYNKARLGKTKDGKQMSKSWVRNRLEKAVGLDLAETIRETEYIGDVQKYLFNLMLKRMVRSMK